MTTARWTSLIIGALCFPLQFDSTPNLPNGWDRMEPMKLERKSGGLPTLLDYDEYKSLLYEREHGRPMRK